MKALRCLYSVQAIEAAARVIGVRTTCDMYRVLQPLHSVNADVVLLLPVARCSECKSRTKDRRQHILLEAHSGVVPQVHTPLCSYTAVYRVVRRDCSIHRHVVTCPDTLFRRA